MRSPKNGPVVAMLGLAIWSGHTVAALADSPQDCAAMADDSARLACYDRIFRGPDGAPVAGTAAGAAAAGAIGANSVQQAAAPAAAVPANPTADFGLTPAQKQSMEAAQSKAAGAPAAPRTPKAPDSLTAKVGTVAHRLTGELVVILDNGQVWLQIDTETKGRVKEGDEVTIRRGTLGSYLLVTPNDILVRVRRVK